MVDLPVFSIVIPVKNAASQIKSCLESIRSLDYPQDKVEIILADGLSKDNTPDIAREYKAKVVPNKRQTVSPGRNVGFASSSGKYICFTDADCVIDKGWLKNSLNYFTDTKVAGIAGPTKTPTQGSNFETAISILYALANKISGSVHRERLDGVSETDDLPGCNAIYSCEALQKVMPIDEGLLTAEDVDMNFRLTSLGYKLLFVPDVIVNHHRRSSPKLLWRQMYRFAIGRLQVGKKNIRMIKLSHVIAGLFLPILFFVEVLLYATGGQALLFINLFLALAIVIFGWLYSKSIKVGVNLLLVMIIASVSWSFGFLREAMLPLKDVVGK